MKKFYIIFLLVISFGRIFSQQTQDFYLLSQINSGSFAVQSDDLMLNGIIGEPFVLSSSDGDLNFSSGFDFPINVTGIDEEVKEKWEFKIFPTLVKEKFTITCSNTNNRNYKIEIFDLLGNKVILDDVDSRIFGEYSEINVSAIQSTGIYLIKINSTTTNFTQTFRIVKI